MSDYFYNEFSAFPAQWLNNLIKKQSIRNGYIDERSISEVPVHDLEGYQQCHFFAGIGGWPIALSEAGWPKDLPVWSGSCPCQPFSSAGKQKGTADDRHLWPEFLRLITARRPPHIFGEQVSGRKVTGKLFTARAWERLEPEARRAAEEEDSEAWFRHVQTDLERVGYVVGHCVFPAASVGAPHARQRLYWYARYVGDTGRAHGERGPEAERTTAEKKSKRRKNTVDTEPHGVPVQLADRKTHRQGSLNGQSGQSVRQEKQAGGYGVSGGMADRKRKGLEGHGRDETGWGEPGRQHEESPRSTSKGGISGRPSPTNGFWLAADWIFCRDNKWRPVEPGSSPLAYGIPFRASKIRAGLAFLGYGPKAFQRVIRKSKEILQEARDSRNGQLSGYGNAIVIPQAVEFIRACMEGLDG